MSLLGALAGRITRIPKIIFTSHGWAFNEDRSNWQKKIIYLLYLLIISLCHQTIAVSEKTKNQILNTHCRSKIKIIKNGIEKINFLDKITAKNELSKKLSPDLELGNRVCLGTISELHKSKGLKYLIEAMHLLEVESDDRADLPVLIIIGEGERREKLQERINRYGLEDTIFLIGHVEAASKYLKAFDVFILSSITEALPYVILEAGQAGLPIIATSVGGIPEIVDDMKNGILVRPQEPEEIQKAIKYILAHTQKRLDFGREIEKKILEEFDKKVMAEKTLALY